jgi:hypothetical protein
VLRKQKFLAPPCLKRSPEAGKTRNYEPTPELQHQKI